MVATSLIGLLVWDAPEGLDPHVRAIEPMPAVPPDAATIAATLWQDLTDGADFDVNGSVGKMLKTNIDTNVGSRSNYAGGPVASVTAPVAIMLSQTGLTPCALDAVADADLTLCDALVCAIAAAAGKQSAPVDGTSYLVKTPSTGTVIRTFTLDANPNPTSRS